jgi:hypothetical protein
MRIISQRASVPRSRRVAKDAFWHLDTVDRVAVEDIPMPYHPSCSRQC